MKNLLILSLLLVLWTACNKKESPKLAPSVKRDTLSVSEKTKNQIDGIDLNGDGIVDIIRFGCVKGGDTFSLVINNSAITGNGSTLDGYYKIVDIDSTDHIKEISISESGPSNDYATQFYYYDGQNICSLGKIEGSHEVKIDGSGIVRTQTRGGILHTWFYPDSYKLSEDHTLEHIDQDLYVMNCMVTMRESLPLQKARGDPEVIVVLAPGEVVKILATDNKEWCLVENSKGIKGWFAVDGYDKIRGINKHGHEVFYGLSYAD